MSHKRSVLGTKLFTLFESSIKLHFLHSLMWEAFVYYYSKAPFWTVQRALNAFKRSLEGTRLMLLRHALFSNLKNIQWRRKKFHSEAKKFVHIGNYNFILNINEKILWKLAAGCKDKRNDSIPFHCISHYSRLTSSIE